MKVIFQSLFFLALFSFQTLCAIEGMPDSVLAIYNGPSSAWANKIKYISDADLLKSLKSVIKEAEKDDTHVWAFANKTLSELHVRPYGKKHLKQLDGFRKRINLKTNTCLVDGQYNVEAAGIKKKALSPNSKSSKVVRPYPYAGASRKVLDKWRKSSTKVSLDTYIKKYMPRKLKKDLKAKSVSYLSPEQRGKYLVTFEKRSLLIGGKKPKNGIYLYALSADGTTLLAGIGKRKSFHHTSFFAGDPVQCAGKFTLKNGKITSLNLISGHYKPSKAHGKNLRRFLSDDTRLGKKQASKLKIKPHS